MKLTKEQVSKLNTIAQEDFEKVKAMLDGINMVLGTEYDWLHKRVIYSDDTSSVAARYATCHDTWANAEE